MSGKNRSAARQAVKDARRIRRNGGRKPAWMRGERAAEAQKLVTKHGNGGTDKSGTVKPSKVYRSQANAERMRGKVGQWEGIPHRPK
jgi:hypothetical protein